MKKNYNEIKLFIDKCRDLNDFPAFDTDKYVDFYLEFPLYSIAPYVIKRNCMIAIDKIYGNNWAFEPKEKRGSYPRYSKLDSLLRGYTRTANTYFKNKNIPPVPLVKILGNYYLDEGNHRLYMSKLLGRKTLLADVIDVDYKYFLQNSYLKEFPYGFCIVYENSLYEVSDIEAKNYIKLKEKYDK